MCNLKASYLLISFFTNRRVLRAAAAPGQRRVEASGSNYPINVGASVSRESTDKMQPRDGASRAGGGGHGGYSRVHVRETGVKVVKLSLGHGSSEVLK